MAHKPIFSHDAEDRWMQVQAEMLETLLDLEPDNYPWEPHLPEPSAETYFVDADSQLEWDEWSDDEIESRSQRFFSQLDRCFSVPVAQRFANLVPQDWLASMVEKAKAIAADKMSLADKLVECVAELVPSLVQEDLFVLARPLAYSMRDESTSIESLVAAASATPWTELSEVSKAKLSLAIARYLIDDAA